ncbi:MAG TPA: ATP-grasp domain-containing protein, partial [Nitriliruptorales bacterium]|nr:ATP-grasp domain-containing protein [Nitriliruptorales bacterium]
MARILLLLPTSTYRASDFIDAAGALGAEVVVASDRRQAMARSMGARALRVDLRRPERAAAAIMAHARQLPFDAVIAVDDEGVLAAALASEQLGLPHNPPTAVARTRDKLALRRALAGVVAQPGFRVADPADDVGALARELGLPVVVKPLSLSASRGVIRADSPVEAAAAAARVRDILACAGRSRDETLLIEEFVPGREVAVEGLLRGGHLEILAIFDKPDPLDGPFFEETIYVTPSREPAEVRSRIVATASAAAHATGLREGPVHAELRVHGDRVTFLELAARSIGGLCARSLRFGLGVRLEELILRHALGLPLATLHREPGASGVMMLPIARAGVLQEVRGTDHARAVPGVVGLEITVPRGRTVQPLPEGERYLGFLFARGGTPQEVEAALRAA